MIAEICNHLLIGMKSCIFGWIQNKHVQLAIYELYFSVLNIALIIGCKKCFKFGFIMRELVSEIINEH